MSVFSKENQAKIKATVKEVEALTSGEVVPVVVPSSSDYRWMKSALFLRGLALTFLILEIWSLTSPWPMEFARVVSFSVLGGALVALLGFFPAVARWVIGVEALDAAAQERARDAFVRHGVMETRDRTGILIFVSQFEHEIVILADRGIHEKLGQKYWDDLCAEFVREVKAKREVDGLCAIIRKAGGELAKHFPRRADDRNELSDELRGRHD